MPETVDITEVLEYAERHYHLSEQYNRQVSLLREVGILDELDEIQAIDGHSYPIPTLEQIAERIFERREELSSKHDQGFTKLLLVPFGMRLDTLLGTLKHFLLAYKQQHPNFELDTGAPFSLWEEGYKEGDTRLNPDGSPVMVYHPTSFDPDNHQGKSKSQILLEQSQNPSSFPGWTVHLLQPSNLSSHNPLSGNLPSPLLGKEGDHETSPFPGIAPIPRQGQGNKHGEDIPRSDLETNQTPKIYLSLLQSSHDNPDSPYYLETGLTPEDWILSFMTHLQETGQPLDDYAAGTQSACFLTGAFFPSSSFVPRTYWLRGYRQAVLDRDVSGGQYSGAGSRSSVMI
jgi:hypothetical protein